VVFEKTRLEGEAGRQVAVGTGETVTIKAGLVLKSIGYKSLAVALPFPPPPFFVSFI
jgi:adrenodoxin-NADP+ reductase